ncbi:TetR family transcriptional regulator [Actinoplanes sp. NPDC048988]|uniref:TetR family transcriptional regulator n=1 Tax=Actinoplanes sp. NPDC048988 TaxID=3363901 RepID=UPI003718341E
MGRTADGRPATSDSASRRERSRVSVERTALALFRRRGYDAVTVEDISAAAGIGPATFYRYFGSKREVLFAYQPYLLDGIREAAERMDVTQARPAQLLEVLTAFAAHLAAQAKAMAARDEIVAANPALLPYTLAVQRDWETHLAQHLARRRGLDEPDLAARADAALILVVIRLAFRQWRAGRSPGLGEAVGVVFAEVGRALGDSPPAGPQ